MVLHMKRLLSVAAVVLAFAVAVFAGWVRLPYYALGPGPAREVLPLIRVEGHPVYASDGRLIMTTIHYEQVTALQAVFAWIDPNLAVLDQDELFPPGETPEQEERRALSEMDQSKIDATSVVLRDLLGYPQEHGDGALIASVIPSCPAEGRLFPGDLVLAVDDQVVGSRREASRLLDAVPTDQPIELRIEAAGETTEVRVRRAACGGDRPLIGITMIDAFPIDVSISSGEVGGPSAGLMWALGLYDLLTPGDLSDGRTVAGTGTIDQRGNVGPIGAIGDKAVGAERAGADVFLFPRDDLAALDGLDVGDLELVPISSFAEALRYFDGVDPS
jgi:Lon-like protease